MEDIELQFLQACQEVVARNQELLPLLGKSLGIQKIEDVFYSWALRQCKQSGQITTTVWSYRFHGLECDLRNRSDGRYLRIDFGPKGRVDTFSAWGVLQFIMTSAFPWPQFDNLKSYFAKSLPPYNQFSGDFDKIHQIWNQLERNGYFDVADKKLIQLHKNYTYIDNSGLRHIKFPPTISEKIQIDSSVAHRKIISQPGYQILKEYQSHNQVNKG